MDIDSLFVPGQLIVSFHTKPRGLLSWFGLGSEDQGVVCTPKAGFEDMLRRFHSMPEGERARTSLSVARALGDALRDGLPRDGVPRPDMDSDIVIAFAIRLVDGPAYEQQLPIHRLGLMLRAPEDIPIFGIPEALVNELRLKM